MPLSSGLRLGPGAGRLEIAYTALSFVAPTRFRFRYRLEGYDNGWVDAGSGRSAGYTNLSPGSYTFHVQAARHNGAWSGPAATLRFTILPPWYRTKTAWCLWILAAALLAWSLLELRTRSLLQHREQLAFLVAERTAQLREEKLAQREVSVLAVVIADLDHFKQINDTRGHLCGDRVLRTAAQRLGFCLREYDSLGRYGGEEFLILMPGYDPAEGHSRLDELVGSIRDYRFVDEGREIRTSCSFGVTAFRPETRLASVEELLAAADAALYRAKAAGRNCATFVELTEMQGIVGRA